MNENLLDISDGKLYDRNDMVKVGCHDCVGCSSCCKNMGQSILLDPYDIWQLTTNLKKSFEELLVASIELHMEEGLILPNLRMVQLAAASDEEGCSFLDKDGRCSIHTFRPGICRLFPLGRNYEPNRLQYFLLKDACPVQGKSKLKVEKWLGIPNSKAYQEYLIRWHNLTKAVRSLVGASLEEENKAKAITMDFLSSFFIKPYDCEDFFEEIHLRMDQWEERNGKH